MDNSISLKEVLIKRTAEQLQLSEDVVERVVMNQFKQANNAMKVQDEVEISGFGKFLQSQNKISNRIKKVEVIKQRLENLIEKASTQEEVIKHNKKLELCLTDLEFYRSKLKTNQ